MAVYAADTFTAVSLLAFNTWPGQIRPSIPFDVSKWIFGICILLSWTLCFYEWFRALRTIRRGSVAKDYLDPLASTIQSIRFDRKGRGWKRFLVFAALTKSKRGADYVALFSYFQFKGAIRILIAEGPRQAINGLTLYAVMQSNLLPNGDNKGGPSIGQFWANVKVLSEQQTQHAMILFTMLFTLIIWLFSALSFIVACVLYVAFLWHYIPNHKLGRYCRRKIDKRIRKIAAETLAKALERREARRQGLEGSGKFPHATVIEISEHSEPKLPVIPADNSDAMSISTTVTRRPTDASLPPYSPEPGRRYSAFSRSEEGLGVPQYHQPPVLSRKPLPFSSTPGWQGPDTGYSYPYPMPPPPARTESAPGLPPPYRHFHHPSALRPGPPRRSMTFN